VVQPVLFCRQTPPARRLVEMAFTGAFGLPVAGSPLGLGDVCDTVAVRGWRGAGFGLKPGWSLGLATGLMVLGIVGSGLRLMFTCRRHRSGDEAEIFATMAVFAPRRPERNTATASPAFAKFFFGLHWLAGTTRANISQFPVAAEHRMD